MVRALAVIMPGNVIAPRKREQTYLDVAADHDRFDIFDLIIRSVFRRHGSALTFAARMTLAQRADSSLMMAANSSGVLPTGTKPIASSRSLISGSDTMRLIS